MMHENEYPHPSVMEAEQLMAFKNTKKPFGYEPTLPVASFASKRHHADDGAATSPVSSSDEEDCGFLPHNRGHKLKKRPSGVTGGSRLLVRDPAHMLLEEQQYVQQQLQRQQFHPDGSTPAVPPVVGTGVTGRHHNKKPIPPKMLASLTAHKREAIVLASQRHPYQHHASSSRPSRVDTVLQAAAGGAAYYDHHPINDPDALHRGDDDMDDDEDPYADIKLQDILAPLESPVDILHRPALRRIFESPELQIMAVHGMAIIEREKAVNKAMSRLAMVLQGDDPFCANLGYGFGEGCSSATMGQPEQAELVHQNKEWKRKGEDREAVQETLALLMQTLHCSNQYIELLSRSRDQVNHVLRQKHALLKKIKERGKRESLQRQQKLRQQQEQQQQQQQHSSSHTTVNGTSGGASAKTERGGSSSHVNGGSGTHHSELNNGGGGGTGGSGRDHQYGYQGR